MAACRPSVLLVTQLLSLPLGSPAILRASVQPTSYGPRRSLAASRSASVHCSAIQTAAEKELDDDRFLVRNVRNDVRVLRCGSSQMLEQGILELQELPHICVAGESNAGKSSLINHLLKKHNVARASSVAGKTRSVDMLEVNERLVITDLPGLPSRDHQVERMWDSSWRPLTLQYLRDCRAIRAMLYVHDIRWKISYMIRDFLRDVEETGVPVLLVLSKDDKLLVEAENMGTTQHELRTKMSNAVFRALSYQGVHIHYSCDNSLPFSRNARRQILRYIEQLSALSSREESAQFLEDVAAKTRSKASPGKNS
eukprot:6208715-Pleurochrysis_carterae.AAC.6